MRIAMIHTPLRRRGGGERQLLKLAIELQKAGHEVEIFTSAVDEEKCYPEMLKKVKVNTILRASAPFKFPVDSSDREVREISHVQMWSRNIIRRQFYTSFIYMITIGRMLPRRFDIVNNHNFPSEWAAFLAKKRLKVPVVWMCNEPPYWFFLQGEKHGLCGINWPLFEVLDKIAVKYIDKIVVLSHITATIIRKTYNRRPAVIRSGIDIQLFQKASGKEVRKRHDLKNNFVLLHVGNLGGNKRQCDSIKALYYLSKDYDNVKLILEGDGERDALMRLCEKFGVKDKVLFLNTTNDEELAKVYAACDVFVFPAQLTWGLAAVEAMAAAKPVIVSKKCGVSEIIQSGANGIVVDHAKPQEIARQVELLMNNPKLRKKLGENAYEYVKNNLSWEKYAKNMESIFQEAISGFRRNVV